MITIQIDEATADGLARQARDKGMSVADYLRTLVPSKDATPRQDWDELEQEILALSTDGPSLPEDFSRADIYADHD